MRLAYNVVLGREPDAVCAADLLRKICAGALTSDAMIECLYGSEESATRQRFNMLSPSLHLSRCQWVRALPPAKRIIDLGGTHLGSDIGALVTMGYPYQFAQLVIVDLPIEDRHELYQAGEPLTDIPTKHGLLSYRYHSMADLSSYDDESFDLVCSGQTIEHVTEDEADHVLREAFRILRPGGFVAIDTPNARATRMQQDEFIDPDHKIEYTHDLLAEKIEKAGLVIREAKGLNHLGRCLDTAVFDEREVAGNQGVYATPDECYVLAFLCQKP